MKVELIQIVKSPNARFVFAVYISGKLHNTWNDASDVLHDVSLNTKGVAVTIERHSTSEVDAWPTYITQLGIRFEPPQPIGDANRIAQLEAEIERLGLVINGQESAVEHDVKQLTEMVENQAALLDSRLQTINRLQEVIESLGNEVEGDAKQEKSQLDEIRLSLQFYFWVRHGMKLPLTGSDIDSFCDDSQPGARLLNEVFAMTRQ